MTADLVSTHDAGLTIDSLDVRYRVRGVDHVAVHQLSFHIAPGEIYGLVGESGSGKSTIALAIERYLPKNGRITSGAIWLDGHDILQATKGELRAMRASKLAMVYQDPGQSLNRSLTVGRQLIEAFEAAGEVRSTCPALARAMLARVRIPDPDQAMQRYPDELSGGMQQRIVIAMALAGQPSLLILDEPTTGLDAVVESAVLALIRTLQRELGFSVLFISHNMAAIARLCDRIGVMYAGHLVEQGSARAILTEPRHPYTAALLRCLPNANTNKHDTLLTTLPGAPPGPQDIVTGCPFAPRCSFADAHCHAVAPPRRHDDQDSGHDAWCHYPLASDEPLPRPSVVARSEAPGSPSAPRPLAIPLLHVAHLSKTFVRGQARFAALDDLTFSIAHGETLGVIGESGSGKSTLARVLSGLSVPDTGARIALNGEALAARVRSRSPSQQQAIQMVFQDPSAALNRAHRIVRTLARVVTRFERVTKQERRARVQALGSQFQLAPSQLRARPRQLSGGQLQRAAIARAFASHPQLVICDEPTSALDASVQAAILNLLAGRQQESGTSYLFISHDLNVVRYLADRILVLYRGRIVQMGTVDEVCNGAQHPYTQTLFQQISFEREPACNAPPHEDDHASEGGTGCAFRQQCTVGIARCATDAPELHLIAPGQAIRCHHFAVDDGTTS